MNSLLASTTKLTFGFSAVFHLGNLCVKALKRSIIDDKPLSTFTFQMQFNYPIK